MTQTLPDPFEHYSILPTVELTPGQPSHMIDLRLHVDFSEEPEIVYYSIENQLPEGENTIDINLEDAILTVSADAGALARHQSVEIALEAEAHISGETHISNALMVVNTPPEEEPAPIPGTYNWRIGINSEIANNNNIVYAEWEDAFSNDHTVFPLWEYWEHPVEIADPNSPTGYTPLHIQGTGTRQALLNTPTDAPYRITYSLVSENLAGFEEPQDFGGHFQRRGGQRTDSSSTLFQAGYVLPAGGSDANPNRFAFIVAAISFPIPVNNQSATLRISVTYQNETQTSEIEIRRQSIPAAVNGKDYRLPTTWNPPNYTRSYIRRVSPLHANLHIPRNRIVQGDHFVFEIGHHPLGPSPLLSTVRAAENVRWTRWNSGAYSGGQVRRREHPAVTDYMRRGMREEGFWRIIVTYLPSSYFGGFGDPLQNNFRMRLDYGAQIFSNNPQLAHLPDSAALRPPLNSLSILFRGVAYTNNYRDPASYRLDTDDEYVIDTEQGVLRDLVTVHRNFNPFTGGVTPAGGLLSKAQTYQGDMFGDRGGPAPPNGNLLPNYPRQGGSDGPHSTFIFPTPSDFQGLLLNLPGQTPQLLVTSFTI